MFLCKVNVFSKFSHLCGYKTQFRTDRGWMRRATAAWRAGRLERSRGRQTIKSVNIPTPEPGSPLHTGTVAGAV